MGGTDPDSVSGLRRTVQVVDEESETPEGR